MNSLELRAAIDWSIVGLCIGCVAGYATVIAIMSCAVKLSGVE